MIAASHSYIIQLLHTVTGSMAFCTLEGGNGTRGKAEAAIYPRGCSKPTDPQSQRATISKFCCHIQTLLQPTIHCLISRRTRNKSLNPSNPRLFRTQRWKSTNGEHDQGDVHWCTSLFMLLGSSSHICNMRFCCTARDWFSTNQTSHFVQRYNKYVC